MPSKTEAQVMDLVKDIENIQKLKNNLPQEEAIDALQRVIKSNLLGCDIVLALFITALNSYRSDKCLRPFPPAFIKNNSKDISSLRNLCDSIPALSEFVLKPSKYPVDMIEFLSWLLIEKSLPLVVSTPFNKEALPCDIVDSCKPNYFFEVRHSCKLDAIFQKRRGDRELITAFHGSSLDNFYSILKNGLQQHFSLDKENLSGNGIYLSSEYSVSSHYSPYSQTWRKSCLGTKHSIIAVCDIIKDAERVKYKDSKMKNYSKNGKINRDIPDKYFVVTDSDMVRLKFLLVYKANESHNIESFFRKNIFWVLLALYFIMLVLIGCNNFTWIRYMKFFTGL